MMHRPAVRFVAIAALLAIAGCPDDGAESATTSVATAASASSAAESAESVAEPAASSASKGGAKSPQAAFEKLKASANGRDYRSLFQVLTTPSQDKMLVGVLIGSGLSLVPVGTKARPGKKKELDAIFDKHGVKDSAKPTGISDPMKMMEQMSKELAEVKDRAGLFDDLMKYLERSNLGQKHYEVVSLENLKQNGKRATGTVVMKGHPKRPVEFHEIDGLWYVYLTKWG